MTEKTKRTKFHYSLFAIRIPIPIFLILLSLLSLSTLNAQVIIKEKVEINPQSVIIPDAPLSNHTIRVDIQWSPASLRGWIMYYDLNCDQNNYSSASSTTGTNSFSHTSPGYENYQIQFRFGSLDPDQPTITGTYQLYYDEQLIRSASFQAQKATYSSYAHFNTHYQSPVLTDYNFSIYASEIYPGSYENIYITTSRNCNAIAEINTELDSITLTIETGKEFVSFYKNSQKKDTVTFMYNELGSIYLMQDSTYSGSTPMDINIKSDWTGIIKYQQLVINPQEQFQIRVPDQPKIVFSGGVGGLKIETYSNSICPPYISENLRYTALIKKGGNRGLLYDYDTGIRGDTLTNLTPQEDGEKYLDFITEGEILNEQDTVLIKIFANDENIDTTEAIIIIYPNDIDVQIIPSVISQGDTARVVLKKRGENGLEDFAIDKLFNVEIVQGLDYGLILDSLSNDTLTIFSNIPQGFKIIAKDSTGIDSTKIRIKVTTEEEIVFPTAIITKENHKEEKQNKVLTKEKKEGGIKPNWIVPGEPIILEGYGDVVVGSECDFDNCGDSYEDILIQVVRQLNFYESGYFETDSLGNRIIKTEIDTVCFRKDSINNVIPDSATGQSRPLKYHRERKNQNGVYEYAWHLKPCKNSSGKIEVRPVLADSVTPTPIYIDFIADVCYTSISNDGYTLITDTTQLSNVVLVPDTAKIIHDLCGHRCYPQLLNKNGFVFKEIVERHELLHMEHFKKILTDTKKDSLVNELKRWVSYTCYDYGQDKKLNSLDGSFDSALREYFSKATRKYWFDYGHTLDAQGNPQIDKTKELAQERKIHYVKGIEDLVKTYHKALSKSRGTIFPDSYNNCTTCP